MAQGVIRTMLHYILYENTGLTGADEYNAFAEPTEITWPHTCSKYCHGQANSDKVKYPCCILCGESPPDEARHWIENHPKPLTDSVSLMERGYLPDQIDEIILSQQYLDGRLPGFSGTVDHDFRTVVAMRFMRHPPTEGW